MNADDIQNYEMLIYQSKADLDVKTLFGNITHLIFHFYFTFHIFNIFIQDTNSISILFLQFGTVQIKVPHKLLTNKLDKNIYI